MPLREFPDSLGRVWQAWDTYPKGANVAGKGDSVLSKYMADQSRSRRTPADFSPPAV